MAQTVKNLPLKQETWVWSLGREDPLEKGMATHSSLLTWRILWTEMPGGPQCMRSQRVRHIWEINTYNTWWRCWEHRRLCVCVCVCVRGQAGVCRECMGNLCTFYPAPPTFWSTFSWPTSSARPPPSCFSYLVLKDMSGSFYMILITISHDVEPSLTLMLCVDLAILFLEVF